MSFPRLADLELLANLSSSQPGLLKCEREEEEEEQEQEERNLIHIEEDYLLVASQES